MVYECECMGSRCTDHLLGVALYEHVCGCHGLHVLFTECGEVHILYS